MIPIAAGPKGIESYSVWHAAQTHSPHHHHGSFASPRRFYYYRYYVDFDFLCCLLAPPLFLLAAFLAATAWGHVAMLLADEEMHIKHTHAHVLDGIAAGAWCPPEQRAIGKVWGTALQLHWLLSPLFFFHIFRPTMSSTMHTHTITF